MKSFCFFVLFGLMFSASAQKDTSCILHLRDENNELLPFTMVEVKANQKKQSVQTDVDGTARIWGIFAGDSTCNINIRCIGYEPAQYIGVLLSKAKPVELQIKRKRYELDEIVVEAYSVPLIDRDEELVKHRGRRKNKEQLVQPPKDTIVYTVAQLDRYSKFGAGIVLRDSLQRYYGASDAKNWHGFLRKAFHYPEQAIQYNISETIHAELTIHMQTGAILEIKLLKGLNPVLALEVAKVLANAPAIAVYKPVSGTRKYTIAIRFVLR